MQRNFSKADSLNETELTNIIKQNAYSLENQADLEPLFERIGNARIVLLGEASYGTHEYYTWRKHISKRLIREKGFNFIAVEGDWQDCYRLNRFVKGYDVNNKSAFKVLNSFNCWPNWLWANWEIASLADWLQNHNTHLASSKKVGFFGLDVYNLFKSVDAIVEYLKNGNQALINQVKEALYCSEPHNRKNDFSDTGRPCVIPAPMENEVINLLKDYQKNIPEYNGDYEDSFNTEQKKLMTLHAEKYYSDMIQDGPHGWNARERHMTDTLERLLNFHGKDAKVIIWAHNTHVMDARASNMVDDGMFSMGQLLRMQHQDKGIVLIGFGSYKGTVMAGENWDGPLQVMKLPEARKSSWEDLLYQSGEQNKLLLMDEFVTSDILMENHIGHREVGMIYHPKYEQFRNYRGAILPLGYDAFIYLQETRALHPLCETSRQKQVPESYPFEEL